MDPRLLQQMQQNQQQEQRAAENDAWVRACADFHASERATRELANPEKAYTWRKIDSNAGEPHQVQAGASLVEGKVLRGDGQYRRDPPLKIEHFLYANHEFRILVENGTARPIPPVNITDFIRFKVNEGEFIEAHKLAYGAIFDFKKEEGRTSMTINWEASATGYKEVEIRSFLELAKEKEVAIEFGGHAQNYLKKHKDHKFVEAVYAQLRAVAVNAEGTTRGLQFTTLATDLNAATTKHNSAETAAVTKFNAAPPGAASPDEKVTIITNRLEELDKRLKEIDTLSDKLKASTDTYQNLLKDKDPRVMDFDNISKRQEASQKGRDDCSTSLLKERDAIKKEIDTWKAEIAPAKAATLGGDNKVKPIQEKLTALETKFTATSDKVEGITKVSTNLAKIVKDSRDILTPLQEQQANATRQLSRP